MSPAPTRSWTNGCCIGSTRAIRTFSSSASAFDSANLLDRLCQPLESIVYWTTGTFALFVSFAHLLYHITLLVVLFVATSVLLFMYIWFIAGPYAGCGDFFFKAVFVSFLLLCSYLLLFDWSLNTELKWLLIYNINLQKPPPTTRAGFRRKYDLNRLRNVAMLVGFAASNLTRNTCHRPTRYAAFICNFTLTSRDNLYHRFCHLCL